MTDIMVDTETTGTDPEQAGIIQLAAIKFNLETLEVGDFFDRCPVPLPRRTWSDGTRGFWNQNQNTLHSIIARQEPGMQVFHDFDRWVSGDAPEGGYRFWAKPVKFDWPLVESHMIQCGYQMPFAHWQAFDVHSYIAGLRGAVGRTEIEKEVPFPQGPKHNALYDCVYQIDLLFHAKRNHVGVTILN